MALAFIDPSVVPYLSTFLLVFAAVFGLLAYSNVGSFGKKVNAMIALAIALFSVFYEPLVTGLNVYMPYVALGLLILFFIVFVKKIFEGKEGKGHDALPIVAAIAIILVVLTVAGDRIAAIAPEGVDQEAIMWAAGILFVILFFAAIYRHSEK